MASQTTRNVGPARWRAAFTGVLSVGAALAVGELVGAIGRIEQTPLYAVGAQFIDQFAASLKEIAVAIFGTNDKTALLVGTVVITLALGALAGLLGRRLTLAVPGLVVLLAGVGVAAQLADERNSVPWALVGAVVAIAVGIGVWRPLVRADRAQAEGTSRRGFLRGAAGAGVGAVAAAAGSRVVTNLAADPVAEADVELPEPQESTEVPDNAEIESSGVSPYVTANGDFYRIDTALMVPKVDADTWQLRIEGMVDEPLTIDYGSLLSMPSVEAPVTLQCVSNTVGGDLVDNAVWQGVRLQDLLESAGVQAGAEQVFTTSADGWTAGFPLSVLDDERTALVAYAMNGEPLPAEHGFPARLVVAGLYGYVSATKWVTSIELSTWADRDGYWVPRGWSKEGPVKLASRIDVPTHGARVEAGSVVLGGVAWLPAVGIGSVEVRVDSGSWLECELAPVASSDTWVQWRRAMPDLAPGRHRVEVRATDADGHEQDTIQVPPLPNGATGLHSTEFDVVG